MFYLTVLIQLIYFMEVIRHESFLYAYLSSEKWMGEVFLLLRKTDTFTGIKGSRVCAICGKLGVTKVSGLNKKRHNRL